MFEQDETINALREALELSPENSVLRGQLARLLMARGQLEQAESLLREGLGKQPTSEVLQAALAECYRKLGNTSAALVIIEDLIKRPNCKPEYYVQYARLLLLKGQSSEAAQAYRRAIALNPELADPDLAAALEIRPPEHTDGWQEEPDVDEQGRIRMPVGENRPEEPVLEMEKPDLGFKDVGGMDDLKKQIRLKIIEPMKHPEVYRAYGKTIGGSLLMYGPPGCGKTYLARATAGEIDAAFYSVGLHDVLDMYIGASEQRLHALFENAREHAPCVLFFDEVDALGSSRSDLKASSGRHLINQFLAELDGIDSVNDGILILAATNAPWHLDPAFRRPGRFDRLLFVPPPDREARSAILHVLLRGKPQADIDYDAIAGKTDKFSGADLKGMVDQAVEDKLEEALDAANEGLTHDPTHQECLNHRAMAMVKLNRHEEAHQTIGQALQDNPENEHTHANLGWTYLHKGQHQKALEHFSEALRLDPNFDYARHGLVEALKARYFLYRWLLRFFLWMSTLSPRARGGIIIGAYILVKVLRAVAQQNPAVAPFILPIVVFYAVFVLLTWVIDPMFNLVLQCNKYGRYALSKRQRWSSAIFGALLLGTIVSVICGAITGLLHFFLLAVNLAVLIIPATRIFKDQEGRIEVRALTLVVSMVLLGVLAMVSISLGEKEMAIAFTVFNVLGAAAFTWFKAIFGLRRQKV